MPLHRHSFVSSCVSQSRAAGIEHLQLPESSRSFVPSSTHRKPPLDDLHTLPHALVNPRSISAYRQTSRISIEVQKYELVSSNPSWSSLYRHSVTRTCDDPHLQPVTSRHYPDNSEPSLDTWPSRLRFSLCNGRPHLSQPPSADDLESRNRAMGSLGGLSPGGAVAVGFQLWNEETVSRLQ